MFFIALVTILTILHEAHSTVNHVLNPPCDRPIGVKSGDVLVLTLTAQAINAHMDCRFDVNIPQDGLLNKVMVQRNRDVVCDLFTYRIQGPDGYDWGYDFCNVNNLTADISTFIGVKFGGSLPKPIFPWGTNISFSFTPYLAAHNCTSGGLCCEVSGLNGTFHLCDTDHCLMEENVCDGWASCGDGSDEPVGCGEGGGGVWGMLVLGVVIVVVLLVVVCGRQAMGSRGVGSRGVGESGGGEMGGGESGGIGGGESGGITGMDG